jgi:putative hydrolase of the HAD superfamily
MPALARRAVTFDAVGTLIAVTPSVGEVYAQVAQRLGVRRDPVALNSAFPAAFRAVLQRWPVPYGHDEADALAFWSEVIDGVFAGPQTPQLHGELFAAFAQAEPWRVLPGVRETLHCLQAEGIPMAVVSNFDARLPRLLKALDLGPFHAVVVSSALGVAKPDPRPLQAACSALGVAATAVLHIGDSAREDGDMATALGAQFMQVRDGMDPACILAQLR